MKKFLLTVLCCCFYLSCRSVTPQIKVTKISQAEFIALAPTSHTSRENDKIPQKEEEKAEEQIDTSYTAVQLDIQVAEPDEARYYNAVLPNNYFSFIAYQNLCEIYFDVRDIESFVCYLNEVKIETAQICETVFCKVDVSAFVKNGRNVLYLSNIVKKTETAKLAVRIPYPILTRSQKKSEAINYESLTLVDELLQAQVANGFPSVQLLVAKDGSIIKEAAYGKIYNDKKFPVTSFGTKAPTVSNRTLYDLASNTKIYATSFAVQRLIFEQKLSLHDKVSKFFPTFKDDKKAAHRGKDEMTIEHLLTHSSGFPAGKAYYSRNDIRTSDKSKRKELVLQKILNTNLINDLGTQVLYSDINFMLLSFIVEKVSGLPFDIYVETKIYAPLHLKRICFQPTQHGFSLSEIAATEYELRHIPAGTPYNGFAHGAVHDPEAYGAMNEVSGHAGLFANAESLAVLAQTVLNGGGYGNVRILGKNTVQTFLATSHYSASFALAWRMQNNDTYKWAFSTFASPHTYGHTGWTGTLSLVDTENNLIIIILTNAKHSEYVGKQKSEGDFFLTRNYGAITSLIYSSFSHYENEYYASMLIELATNRFELIAADSRFDNPALYADIRSIMHVIKKYASGSASLKKFLKSETAKKIQNALDKNVP